MQLGIIGLGRMGANIARRLMQGGHTVVVYTRDQKKVEQLVGEGAVGAESLDEFVDQLESPKAAWVMVPAGDATESVVNGLEERFFPGDIIIDGGNSYFKDDVRRGRILQERGILYLDVGTSGGVWGLERGYCLMIGGESEAFLRMEPIFRTLAPGTGDIPKTPGRTGLSRAAESGYLHCGPVGSGHFVKMIHNGIEYGMMQALAEGMDILKHADSPKLPEDHRFSLNLADIAEVWRRGSVISSWLLDLIATALAADGELSRFTGIVHDSGEGRWTISTAIEESVPANVLAAALFRRFRSQNTDSFAEKLLAAMRYQFGGHRE